MAEDFESTSTNELTVKEAITSLKASLLPSFDILALLERNQIAHKWKATYRSLLLREAVHWRITDLLEQSYALHELRHSLGALILLRSALETLATLIHLNELMANVVDGKLKFHEFSNKTTVLLLGSRDGTTPHSALSIITVLKKCAQSYDFIEEFYAKLSEVAHPNYEGLMVGYSAPDTETLIENFSNRWADGYFETHEEKMKLVIDMFEYEYNIVWQERFEALEKWLVSNDAELERTKSSSGRGDYSG